MRWILLAVVLVGLWGQADAAVLCQKKNGALFVREECKFVEHQIDPVAVGLQGPTGPPGPQGETRRSFYLTRDGFDGSQALDACAEGYHMASLWEIFAVSGLTYNTTLGHPGEDAGSGPPANVPGWIRTGASASTAVTSGFGNCYAWTSNRQIDTGTRVGLFIDWEQPGLAITPWRAGGAPCDWASRVWCVSDK
jgi:hypothetical protein